MAQFTFPPISVDTSSLATEATLLDVKQNTADTVTELQTLNTVDFATETTLSALNGKDFATETTLSALNGKDFATETTAAASLVELQSISSTDFATESTLGSIAGSTSQTQDRLKAVDLRPVDFFDSSVLLDTSTTNIPASSSSPLQVVATLASLVRRIQSVEDIGQYIGIYTGAAASEVLLAVLPLGGGEVSVDIAAGTRISLRAMENTAISSGKIAINFLGP